MEVLEDDVLGDLEDQARRIDLTSSRHRLTRWTSSPLAESPADTLTEIASSGSPGTPAASDGVAARWCAARILDLPAGRTRWRRQEVDRPEQSRGRDVASAPRFGAEDRPVSVRRSAGSARRTRHWLESRLELRRATSASTGRLRRHRDTRYVPRTCFAGLTRRVRGVAQERCGRRSRRCRRRGPRKRAQRSPACGHDRDCERLDDALSDQLRLAGMQHLGEEQREFVAARAELRCRCGGGTRAGGVPTSMSTASPIARPASALIRRKSSRSTWMTLTS